MEFIINHAILHVLNMNEVHYSNQELDIDSDTCCNFISKHLKKILNDAAAKEAVFDHDSEILALVNTYMDSTISFREFSVKTCEKLSALMKESGTITPADMLIVQFDIKNNGYLALIKLNYKECFTHKIGLNNSNNINESSIDSDINIDNQIVNVPSLDSSKIEDACIIPYNPMILRVLEKPCEIGGNPTFYFSELFLKCSAEMSKKEIVQIINDIAGEINAKHFSDSLEVESRVKIALIEEALEEDGMISMQNVASKAFPDNEEVRCEFVELSKEAGIIKDVHLGEKYAKQQFSSTKFKSDNGIEIKYPSGFSDDSSIIEFQNNDDGSVTIIMKNMRRA